MNKYSVNELLEERSILLSKNNELSAKLYRVNNKLKESEALKGHFISNITNEIINPFSSILVLAENLQKLEAGSMDKAKEMASMISDEALHLDFQLKNIFAAASIEAGKDDLKPVTVNLINLFGKTVSYFQKQIDNKLLSVDLFYDDSNIASDFDMFIADEAKLELVVLNLLDNAIKFSPKKAQIDIALTMKNEQFSFAIHDYGKGIPDEKKQAIFDRFQRLDDRINSINTGHGLGLSIVNSYVQFMSGQLKLDQERTDGVTFTVYLKPLERNNEWDDLNDFLINPDEKF